MNSKTRLVGFTKTHIQQIVVALAIISLAASGIVFVSPQTYAHAADGGVVPITGWNDYTSDIIIQINNENPVYLTQNTSNYVGYAIGSTATVTNTTTVTISIIATEEVNNTTFSANTTSSGCDVTFSFYKAITPLCYYP